MAVEAGRGRKFLSLILAYSIIFGMWYLPEKLTPKLSKFLTILIWFYLFIMAIVVQSEFWAVYFYEGDVKDKVAMMMLFVVGMSFTVNNIYIGINKSHLKMLVKKADRTIEIISKLNDDKNGEKLEQILSSWEKKYRIIILVWANYLIFSGVHWAFHPLIREASYLINNNNYTLWSSGEEQFPLITWFPVDKMQSPWYEIIYFVEVITSFRFSSTFGVLDCLTISFMMLTYPLLKRLEHASKFVDNHDDLLRWIKGHQTILNMYEDFSQKFIPFVILFALIRTLFALISLTFIFSTMDADDPSQLNLIGYYVVHEIELFFITNIANMIHTLGTKLNNSLYEINWVPKSISYQRNILFCMMKASKPLYINIYSLNYDLEVFVEINRLSFSVFMLLRQISETTFED